MKPDIILILIDSCNYRKIISTETITPNIDRLIKNGVTFSNTTSVADATLLSTTGLFTAMYPFKTGIRSPKNNKLNENITTIFSILEKEGYENYGYRPTLQENDDLFPNFRNDDDLYDVFTNMDDGLGKKIIRQLQKKGEKPRFFFIHPHDLHQPIVVSKEFDNEKFGIGNYERQAAALDSWLGKIIEQVELENTLIVITGDHGSFVKSFSMNGKSLIEADGLNQLRISKISNNLPEFLDPIKKKLFFALENRKQKKKEHIISELDLTANEKRNLLAGRFTVNHTLFEDQIRIPLIFSGYNVRSGLEIDQQVRNIDISPTILDIIGISNELTTDGISLKKFIDGEDIIESPAFLETNPLIIRKSDDVIGIRTSEFKYFRNKENQNKNVNLYNLKDDPYENNNLKDERKDVVLDMEKQIRDIIGDHKI